MTDVIKTSPVAPSITLSLMAWRLAWRRTYGAEAWHSDPPGRCAELHSTSATAEFYRVLDRLSAGKQP